MLGLRGSGWGPPGQGCTRSTGQKCQPPVADAGSVAARGRSVLPDAPGGLGLGPPSPSVPPEGSQDSGGPCSLDKTPRAPGSPHVLPTPRSPPGLGAMSGPLRGASRPHTGAFGQGGAGVGGQGDLGAGGQLRDSGRGLGGRQRRPASHIRRAPRLPGKRSRQFTARPGVFIPNGGGGWVPGGSPPPATCRGDTPHLLPAAILGAVRMPLLDLACHVTGTLDTVRVRQRIWEQRGCRAPGLWGSPRSPVPAAERAATRPRPKP